MQTNYRESFQKYTAGLPVNEGVTESITKNAEDILQFGYGVVRGTNSSLDARKPTGSGDEFIGIAGKVENEEGVYEEGMSANVWTKGNIAVPVLSSEASGVDAGVTAYLVASGTDAGKFSTTSTDNIEVGKFTGRAENDIAPVKIDLSN